VLAPSALAEGRAAPRKSRREAPLRSRKSMFTVAPCRRAHRAPRLFSDRKVAALAQSALHVLRLVVAQGLDHLVVGVGERPHHDLALRRVAVAARAGRAQALEETAAEKSEIEVLGAALGADNCMPDRLSTKSSVVEASLDFTLPPPRRAPAEQARASDLRASVPLAAKLMLGLML